MRLLLIGCLILIAQFGFCSGIYNPGSGSGSSGNFVSKTGDSISGDLTFTTAIIGPVLTDSAGCTWRTTIATTGNLVTTLVACPVSVVSRPCTTGMSLGLLLAITCP